MASSASLSPEDRKSEPAFRSAVGITDFRFHDLCHTWASWHVTNVTSLQELMELGGWKSYDIVLRYAHLAPDHLSHAAARIERTLAIVESNSTKTLRSDSDTIEINDYSTNSR